jgi:Domain of unknown function (DUF4129)
VTGGPASVVAGMAGGHRPEISRPRGEELARRELARAIYRPSLLVRLWHDITHWLSSLVSTTAAGSPSWWGLILLAVAVAAAVTVAMYWLGPARLSRSARSRPVLTGKPRSADEHRRDADRLAASGSYGEAIVERIRAIVVDLEAREILLRRPARTAMELAVEAGAAFPAEAGGLTDAARSFDAVRYGGRAGTEAGYRAIRELDVRLKATAGIAADQAGRAPVPAGLPPAGPTLGGPDRLPGLAP